MRKVLVIVGLVLVLAARAYAYDDGDFQVWNTEVEEFNLNKNSRLTLEEEFRWGDDADEFYYQHYDLGYAYDLNKHLTLGLNYRQVYEKKQAHGKFKAEERPHLNATLKYMLAGFKLDDRNRLEYRHFNYQTDSWRYRNKFTLTFPWKFTRLQIQPYVADEIFLPLNGINLSRNRFYAGFGFTFSKNLKAEVYYLLQSTKSSNTCVWTQANVLGTKIKLVF
jgi:hypothetical protein